MIFTIMNRDNLPLVERGYRISEEHETIIDRKVYETIVREKGMDYAIDLIRSFGSCNPVCLGEDGVFYTVLFDNVTIDGEDPMPCAVAWHEIEVILERD